MDSVYGLIQTIAKRPEIYLGRPSVQRLHAFLNGYLYQNDALNDHCLDGFNAYVAERFGIRSDHNWASIIEFFADSEQEEFPLFLRLFEDFIADRRSCDGTEIH